MHYYEPILFVSANTPVNSLPDGNKIIVGWYAHAMRWPSLLKCYNTFALRVQISVAEYESGHKLRHLPCGHGFHRECIDTWMGTAETCPKCRKNVVGCLRRLQMKEAHMRSQSLTKPLPSLRVPSVTTSGTTDSSVRFPHPFLNWP